MLINFATLFDLIYSVFIFIVMPVITKKRTDIYKFLFNYKK